jgi:exodeoxyribonuclease VII large subunit
VFNAETKHFKNSATNYLLEAKNGLVLESQKFKNEAKSQLSKNRDKVNSAQNESRIFSSQLIKHQQEKVEEITQQFPTKINNQLEKEKLRVLEMENMVRLMDPRNVLKRGYSITTLNGQTIQKNNQAKIGDTIQTVTFDFEISSTILKTEENGE